LCGTTGILRTKIETLRRCEYVHQKTTTGQRFVPAAVVVAAVVAAAAAHQTLELAARVENARNTENKSM
jgi:NO-binding membrane sensor protein with MHYT domain